MRIYTSNTYLRINNNSFTTTTKKNNASNFVFYPIATSLVSVPISVINKQTGEANPVTAIQRNDLINILITANYNEKLGHFTFEVADWKQIQGGVTFD